MSDVQLLNSYESQAFNLANDELRIHFSNAQMEIDKVKSDVNRLVVIVHNDNKKWSVKRICDYIAGKNDDLEKFGFSTRTIYNYLSEESRQLVHKYKKTKPEFQESKSLADFRKEKGKMLQNNDEQQSFESVQNIVADDSSRTNVEETIIEDGIIVEGNHDSDSEPEGIPSDDTKTESYTWGLEAKISKMKDQIRDLKTVFESYYTVNVKGQDIPLIIKVNPAKKLVTSVEFDAKEAKRLSQ